MTQSITLAAIRRPQPASGSSTSGARGDGVKTGPCGCANGDGANGEGSLTTAAA